MLKFADPFFYPTTGTPTPPALATQISAMYEVNTATISVGTAGRFPGTAAIRTSSFGALGKYFTVTGSMVRWAADVGITSLAAEQPIFLLSDRRITANTNLTTATNQTGVFFSITRNTAGNLLLRKAAATLATSAGVFNSISSFYRIQVEANLLVAGNIKIYVNGTLAIDYSGDLVGTATLPTDRYLHMSGTTSVNVSHLAIWDDTNVSPTAFTGILPDFRIGRLLPTGPGSITQGTPIGAASNWEAVDDPFRAGGSDYVQFTTNGHKDLYTYEDLPPNVTSVLSIIAQPAAYSTGTRPAKIRAEAKSGAATSFVESEQTLQTGALDNLVSSFTLEIPLNPETSVSWTPAEVNAAEFGVSAVFL